RSLLKVSTSELINPNSPLQKTQRTYNITATIYKALFSNDKFVIIKNLIKCAVKPRPSERGGCQINTNINQ
ncbi:hypothetical protein, partial [Proteus mirabilis]|uniref:hypothetical protein n=1 Tax=Proteus mirabilis TaxID=584 RepID=UPI001FABBA86